MILNKINILKYIKDNYIIFQNKHLIFKYLNIKKWEKDKEYNADIIEYLNTIFPWSNNIKIQYYCLLNNISEEPRCPVCNNIIVFKKNKYWNHCSSICGTRDTNRNKKIRETCLLRYGVDNIFKDQDRIRHAITNKYGVDNPSKVPEIIDKRRNSNLIKYGKINILAIPENLEKSQKALKNSKNTYRHKSKEEQNKIKQKISLGWTKKPEFEKKEVHKRRVNTLRNRSEEEKIATKNKKTNTWNNKTEEELLVRSNKTYKAKKKNNSFKSSKSEKFVLDILKKYYEVVYQYRDSRYPYNCDFYIPQKDLFIEIQGNWTHGKEPFDKNNEKHIEIIDKWKNKHTKYYDLAITVWTISDVKKRNIAKNNNLNFLEIFNYKDTNKLLESINKFPDKENLDV